MLQNVGGRIWPKESDRRQNICVVDLHIRVVTAGRTNEVFAKEFDFMAEPYYSNSRTVLITVQ